MSNTILIKRSSTANAVPTAGSLAQGELALNLTDGNLFYKNASDQVTVIASNKFVSVTGNINGGNVVTGGLISATGQITGSQFNGSGAGLSAIPGANVTGTVPAATIAATVTTAAQPNITSVGTLSSVTVTANVTGGNLVTAGQVSAAGNVTGAYILGNISQATGYNSSKIYNGDSSVNIATANGSITLNVANSTISTVSSTGVAVTGVVSASGNVTGGNVVTAGLVSATGTITGSQFNGSGAGLTSIPGANVTGQVANALVAGTVYTAAQPNITSVGTLTSLAVTGNISGGNLSGTSIVGTLTTASQTNITAVGNVTGGTWSATAVGIAYGGTGKTTAPAAMAALMGYTSTATAAGTTALTNTSSYYQQFTGTSTQTVTLPVTSTLQTGWTFHIVNNSTGNVTVQSSGLNTVIVVIPGTTAMLTCIGTALTTAADWEAGLTDFSTYTGTGAVVLATSPTLVTPVIGAATGTSLSVSGNVTGGNIVTSALVQGATLSATGNITGGNISVTGIAGTLSTAAQPNITSVGTLTSLAVTGNITGGNVNATHYGNGAGLSSITGANVTGTVASATTAGTVTTAAQPNITSVGTLSSVTVTANVTGGNLVTAGTVYGKDALFTGNLTVDGDVTYINITNLSVQDPVISLGTGPNGAPLTTNDGKDRGELLNYYNTAGAVAEAAFIGYQNLTGKLIAATNVSVASDVITVNSYGTLVIGGLEAATVSATGNVVGGNLVTGGAVAATGAITGASLSATGNVVGGNITTAGTGSLATLIVSTLANITASTAATNTTSGALKVAGGAGIGGNVYAGAVYSGGALTLTVDSTVDGGTY